MTGSSATIFHHWAYSVTGYPLTITVVAVQKSLPSYLTTSLGLALTKAYYCTVFFIFFCLALNPATIVISPHLLLHATTQMVHLLSTFAWLILRCGCQYGCSAGDTHYTVSPVCALCVCVCAWYLFSLKSPCTSTLSIRRSKQCVVCCGQVFKWRVGTLKSITENFLEGDNWLIHQDKNTTQIWLKRKPKIWPVDSFPVPRRVLDSFFPSQQWCSGGWCSFDT